MIIFKSNSIFCSILFLMSTEMRSIYPVEWNQPPLSSPKIYILYGVVKIDKFLAFLGQPHLIWSWFLPASVFIGSLLVSLHTLLWNSNVSLNFVPALPWAWSGDNLLYRSLISSPVLPWPPEPAWCYTSASMVGAWSGNSSGDLV